MSLNFYKLVHLFGVLVLFMSLGGATLLAIEGHKASKSTRMLVGIGHGVALLVILIAGFGALAKLGLIWPLPGWVWAKLALWMLLGAALMIPLRLPQLARPLWFLLPVLGGLIVWLAIYKPF